MSLLDPEPERDAAGDAPDARSRNRPATEQRILDATQAILTESGASGFGINAVARAASVDKQLIYRYFGGLDGLLAALGERIAEWWQDRLLADAPETSPATYAEMIEMLALRLLHIMRTEPLALQSALWELTDRSGLVAPLTASRSRALAAWMARTRGSLQPPEGVDAPAVNAILVSAISSLVLASQTSGSVVGLPLGDDQSWARLERALRDMVQRVCGRA